MTDTTLTNPPKKHGGPRPAVRPDDKRRTNSGYNLGAGPKPTKFTVRHGQAIIVTIDNANGDAIVRFCPSVVSTTDRGIVTITTDDGIVITLEK